MKHIDAVLFYLLSAALFWFFLRNPGTSDVQIWRDFMALFAQHGLRAGYEHIASDIPPLQGLGLWAVARVSQAHQLNETWVLKLAAATFGCAGVVMGRISTQNAAVGYLLLAATLANYAQGYLDVVYLPFLILALGYFVKQAPARAGLFFALACAIKWQPLVILPFLALHLMLHQPRPATTRFILGALPVALASLYFGVEPLLSLRRALSHDYFSAYALNLPWLVTAMHHYAQPGAWSAALDVTPITKAEVPGAYLAFKSLFFIVYLALLVQTRRRADPGALLALALLGFFSYFMLNTGVHENHLFVGCVVAALLCALRPDYLGAAGLLVAMNGLNILTFYGLNGPGLGYPRSFPFDLSILLALFNALLFGRLAWMTVRATPPPHAT